MNKAQRAGLLVGIFLLVCLTLAHYPFDGYTTKVTIPVERLWTRPCPPMPSMDELSKLDAAGARAVVESQGNCGSGVDYVTTEFPFAEWVSVGAIIDSLARVKHVLVALALLVLGVALWIFHYRRRAA